MNCIFDGRKLFLLFSNIFLLDGDDLNRGEVVKQDTIKKKKGAEYEHMTDLPLSDGLNPKVSQQGVTA